MALCVVAMMVALCGFIAMPDEADAVAQVITPDTSWYNDSSPTFTIWDKEGLAGLASLVNSGAETFDGKTIELRANIDLDGCKWIPIGNSGKVNPGLTLNTVKVFEGTFNGNGHTISNLSSEGYVVSSGDTFLNDKNGYTYGLFGFVNNATIDGINLVDVDINISDSSNGPTADSVGAAVGYGLGETEISNIKVSGSISAPDAVGGVIGRFYGDDIMIEQCSNSADIKATGNGETKAGGIVGIVSYTSETSVQGCSNTGDVEAIYAGGIIGLANSNVAGSTHTFSDCYVSDVTITASDIAGGIIGRGSIGITIKDCDVTDSSIIAGESSGASGVAGGLIGSQHNFTTTLIIEGCKVEGSFVSSGAKAGGFVAHAASSKTTISGGSVYGTTVSATNTNQGTMTLAGGVVGEMSHTRTETSNVPLDVLIDGVDLRDVILESSTENYYNENGTNIVYGILKGAVIANLLGDGVIVIKDMSDFDEYELIAQSNFGSYSNYEGKLTLSNCKTENLMDWMIAGTVPEVHVVEGSDLSGFRINNWKMELYMDGGSIVRNLMAGPGNEMAEIIDSKLPSAGQSTITIPSGVSITVENAIEMEEYTTDSSSGVRKYSGKITGEDDTSCLIVTVGDVGFPAGTYQWDVSDKRWVSYVAQIIDGESNTMYSDLDEAIEAIPTDGTRITFKLLSNLVLEESLTISNDADVILDLGIWAISANCDCALRIEGADVLIQNGFFSANNMMTLAEDANVRITGGYFDIGSLIITEDFTGTLTISGGTYTCAIPERYIDDGYELREDPKGTYSVVEVAPEVPDTPGGDYGEDDEYFPFPPQNDVNDDTTTYIAAVAAAAVVALLAILLMTERKR